MTLNSKNYGDTVLKQEELYNILLSPLPSPASVNQTEYNEFTSQLENFYNDRFEASQNSQKLSDNILNLLEVYNFVSDDADYTYTLMKNLYDAYGIDDNDVVSEATYMVERRENRQLLNSSIKGIALIYMMLAAVKIEFKTSEDLLTVQNEIRDRYRKEADNNTLIESIWSTFENIKFKTFKYLSQLKVNEVVTTKITRHTLLTFLYDYYENFDFKDEIVQLNGIFNPARLEGEVKMVTTDV